MQSKFNVTGMSCAACSSHVEKAISSLDGVEDVQVNLLTGLTTVKYSENLCDDKKICDAVYGAGYGISGFDDKKTQDSSVNDDKNQKTQLILSFILLIVLMYISMGHMLGLHLPSILNGKENVMSYALTQFILTIPLLFLNKKYFINGFTGLIHRSPTMDALVAVGSSAAFIYSIFSLYRISYFLGHSNFDMASFYAHDLYFESAGMILTLVSLGKYLENRAKNKTTEAISKLISLSPKTATVIRDDTEINIPAEQVVIGDIVAVRSGESVPVDGVILSGFAVLDESALTGESIPAEKQEGERVISGSINKSGFFTFRALEVGGDTTLAQMIKLVEQAASSKAPIARLADRVSGVFVPAVLLISLITAIIWLFLGSGVSTALSHAVTVLVISCPCALGLATPVAIMVGTGIGAQNGVLFQSAESLEHLKNVTHVVLDKTGTVTNGKPSVSDVITLNGFSQNELLKVAASLENPSEHPLAKAIVAYAENQGICPENILSFNATAGRGISGIYNKNNVIAGNLTMMSENNLQLGVLENYNFDGKTPIYFAENNKLIGVIVLSDEVKTDSQNAVEALKNLGIEVSLLTGDNESAANAAAKNVGISTVLAGVLPQDKEKYIKSLQKNGHIVAMIGDGINDAPALMRADVGIAIGTGSDIAIDSADVLLMKSSLIDAVNAIRLSKAVVRNIKQNLFWAFFYNCIGIPLAAGLFEPHLSLTPMFGAAAMSLSSVCVVTNALRIKKIKLTKHTHERKEEKQMKKTIKITGMMCPHCSSHVQKALCNIDGILEANVSHETGLAEITLKNDISNEVLSAAITDAGYKVVEIL